MTTETLMRLSELGWRILEVFSTFFTWFVDTSLNDVLDLIVFDNAFTDIISWLIDVAGWGDITLFELTLGTGVITIVGISLIKWVKGIIL